jgi:hypothetical protein
MIYSLQEKQKIKLLHLKQLKFNFIKISALLISIIFGLCLPTSSFATPIWSIPSVLPNSLGIVHSFSFTQDSNGQGLAAWSNGISVFSAIQTKEGAWQTPIPVVKYTRYGDSASSPEVAFTPNGTAAVVWTDSIAGIDTIKVATLTSGSSKWSVPTRLSPLGSLYLTGSMTPKIRFDGKGNGIVMWVKYVADTATAPAYTILQSSTYTAGTGWSNPVNLSPNDGSKVYSFDLAVNAAGDTVVVWSAPGATLYEVYLQTIRKPARTNAWSAPIAITTDFNSTSKLVLDDAGRATIAWTSPITLGLYAAQSSATGIWSLPKLLSNDPSNESPDIAADKAGNVMLVWNWALAGHIDYGIKARMLRVGSSVWTDARKLSSPVWYERGRFPKVAASPDGSKVVVMWNDIYDPYVSTYNPALDWTLGWTAPTLLAPPIAVQKFGSLSLSAGSGGTAHAVWSATAPDDFNSEILGVTLIP